MGNGARAADAGSNQRDGFAGSDHRRRDHAEAARSRNDDADSITAWPFRKGGRAAGDGRSGFDFAVWRAIQDECSAGAPAPPRQSAPQDAALASATEITGFAASRATVPEF